MNLLRTALRPVSHWTRICHAQKAAPRRWIVSSHVKMEAAAIPAFPGSYPDLNPVDIYRSVITKALSEISGVQADLVYPALQWQTNLTHADLLLAVPRLRIKGRKPDELAADWAARFPSLPLVSPPEADGIYLRFRFAPALLPSTLLPMIFRLGDRFGHSPQAGLRDPADPSKGRKTAIVEFSSPNIAKEFHAGHLRSTIIGAFIANLYEAMGWDVTRMNYLGDWGRQYGLLAVGWQRYGNEEAFETNPIKHLFDIYVKISADFKPEEEAYKAAAGNNEKQTQLENQGLLGESKAYFKRMEDGDEEALSVWRRFRNLSIEKYKKTYSRLNINFDVYSGESQVKSATMERAEKALADKGVTELDKGATILNFKKHGAKKLETAVVRNRNGTSNYLLRDVGSLMERWDQYHFDKVIYVIMSEQDLHVARNFKATELVGGEYETASKRAQHVSFGKVAGMSTRRGTVRFLDDILEEVATSMHEVMRKNESKYAQVENPEKTADTLGISAVMVQDMSGKRVNNYPFDIARMTSFEGDTGPYLQYAHARLSSIARKAELSPEALRSADFSLLREPHAIDLLRLMAQFPDICVHAFGNLEPTTVLGYLFKMTHQLSSSYDILRVVNPPEGPAVGAARAALYDCARQVLGNGMRILGLTPLDRM